MSPVKRICVFEHSVMTNFNCACPAIQRGQGSGFLSEGSSWFAARIGDKYQIHMTQSILCCIWIVVVNVWVFMCLFFQQEISKTFCKFAVAESKHDGYPRMDISYSSNSDLLQNIRVSFRRNLVFNCCFLQTENSVPQDNCSTLKPHDAEQSPLRWNSQTTSHNHQGIL